MHFFTFSVRPFDGSRSGYAGAFANCWIEQPDRNLAEALARRLIAQESWRVESLDEYRVVTSDDYQGGAHGREYYEQACIDGEVLVFHTWPASGEHEQ